MKKNNKNILKGAVCVGLCCALLAAPACKSSLDSETRQLQLSTAALDGNFNPFFYTSANDGDILSMTQIGMLTTDESGNLVCGEDQACAVLDYTTTMYDAAGKVSADGDNNGTTVYEFAIKKGVKFSDGEELTIKDVLFNLYVYLDPAYTGSTTIYSTDIQGLKAYRAQDASLSDDSDLNINSTFTADAQARILSLITWADDKNTTEADLTSQQKSDLAKVKELFKEEATSDWTSVESSWYDSYKDSYRFTSAWEAYLFNEGIVTVQTKLNANGSSGQRYDDTNANGKKDDGELYYTTLDADTNGTVQAQHHIDGIADATSSAKVSAYMTANKCSEEYAITQLQKEYCVQVVYDTYTDKSEISNVLQYWATAANALEEFTGEARTEYYDAIKARGELPVPTISGITTYQTSSFNGKALDGNYDVLKITINGVDPKAIYNFGFTVAPLHYYSGTYEGVDYVAQADGKTHFGVDIGNKDFYDSVIQASEKNGLPVGAGAYMATNSNGGDGNRSTFFENNIVYFKRNDYFETLGSGIENAKIKYVNYKVLADDRIVEALTSQTIDFGMPSATPSNTQTLSEKFLTQTTYSTGGYGYVGINPKFVPEYKVRQAIMKAMNTTQTIGYYGTTLASNIYRPMSKTSWAYPTGATQYSSIAYTTSDAEIKKLIEDSGYTLGSDGIYVKTKQVDGMANAKNGTKLELTFTIAGETTDHPAYLMFCTTRDRLNAIGFNITVKTDIQALKNMTTGNLAVWAAAWSAAADPDPYQVYHKDSNATSVNNWNYPNILKDTTTWSYEASIIDELSEKIDEGRETLNQTRRAAIYSECLDLIMDLAVELPTYQRSDLCVYNNKVIDGSTLVKNPSYNMGLFSKIWEIDYVK